MDALHTSSPVKATGESPLMRTLREFERAWKGRSPEGMRRCLHADASIESTASGGRALGARDTVDAVATALRDTIYHVGDWEYEPLSDDLVIVRTSVRHRSASGGFSHHTVYRATIGRDGLMFRVRVFDTHAEALRFLETYAAATTVAVPATAETVRFLREALLGAMEAVGAEAGSGQLYDAESRSLVLYAHVGVEDRFVDYFRFVGDDASSCGVVLRQGVPVWVEDVSRSPIYAGTQSLEVLHDSRVHAVASLPITTESGDLLGVFSPLRYDAGAWRPRERRALQVAARSLAGELSATAA